MKIEKGVTFDKFVQFLQIVPCPHPAPPLATPLLGILFILALAVPLLAFRETSQEYWSLTNFAKCGLNSLHGG